MNVMLGGFHGNPNIGLYGFATDKFVLLGKEIPERMCFEIKAALEVPVIRMNIAGTSMIGLFITGNSNGVIVPEIAYSSELKILHDHKIPYTVVDSELTCLGNNVIVNDKIGYCNPGYSKKSIEKIEQALKIKLTPLTIAEMDVVGALAVVNKFGGLIHNEASDEEIEAISKLTEEKVMLSTLNYGNPYIKSSILSNNKGIVIGNRSTGVEVADAESAFGVTGR